MAECKLPMPTKLLEEGKGGTIEGCIKLQLVKYLANIVTEYKSVVNTLWRYSGQGMGCGEVMKAKREARTASVLHLKG